ncbi:MAG TPA: ferrous iron transporter B, partial [Ignavibacteria bacterium]|nr:ferrous iron transporter B [Ignavibacteria bacterium]
MSNKEYIIKEADDLRWELGENFHDHIIESIYNEAGEIAAKVINQKEESSKFHFDQWLDKLVTSRLTGFPIMFLLLAVVFWITIEGSNIPSGLLASLLVDTIHPELKLFAQNLGIPVWINGLLIDGAYLAMAWVIAVMLPPMAIFFPLFTLLE